MKTRKIGIIGLGHVGAHVAYSLAVQGIADQLVLVDQNAQKVKSECQDLRDSAAYLPHRVTVDGRGRFFGPGGLRRAGEQHRQDRHSPGQPRPAG